MLGLDILQTIKQFLPILIITIVLGYFLGLSVSTVVDYRLKDTIINLPRPKNNIVVKLDDTSIQKETFIGSKKISNSKKQYKKSKSIKEGFNNYSSEKDILERVEKITKTINKNLPSNNFEDTIIDNNVNSYALAYEISKNAADQSNKKYPYLPFNYEDSNLNYSSIGDVSQYSKQFENSNREIRPAKNSKPIKNLLEETISNRRPEDLPLRQKRDMDFLKQRPWQETKFVKNANNNK